MPIFDLLDALGAQLQAAISPPPALLGGAVPTGPEQLPAVVLSVPSLAGLPGLGRVSRLQGSGPLRTQVAIDLAHPQLAFPDATVPLLSADRRTLQAPHGGLVRADGSPPPLAAGDLTATLGATSFALVNAPPAAGQFRPDAAAGVLLFGAPLPAAGSLALSYFVGSWEIRSVQYRGTLQIDVFAVDAPGVEVLSQKVATALHPEDASGIDGLEPLVTGSWGAIVPAGSVPAVQARSRTMTFTFSYDDRQPFITSGGGPIRDVAVDLRPDGASVPEHFEVSA